MPERFTRLFSLPDNLYAHGAPVLIVAGALLKDNTTGNIIGQLKMKNIYQKSIKAVKVKLFPKDIKGQKLGDEITYDYLDLLVNRDEVFGQKKAIILQEKTTRAFDVEVIEVVFADNSIWSTHGEKWEALPSQTSLQDYFVDDDIIKLYKVKYGEQSVKIPSKTKDIWLCSCGAINKEIEEKCHVCNNEIDELLSCNYDDLKKEVIYSSALMHMNDKTIEGYESAINEFLSIPGWKDSDERVVSCKKEIESIKERARQKEEERKRAKDKRKKITVISLLSIAVCIAIVFLVIKVVIPNNHYNKAVALYESGEYEAAIAEFRALGEYKDSKEQIKAIKKDIIFDKLKNAKKGDVITFGKNDMEWIVLKVKDNKKLLITKNLNEQIPFNEIYESVTWKSSTLRKYLNGEWYKSNFNKYEKSFIETTTVTNYKYSKNKLVKIKDTKDKVFLLSSDEARKYISKANRKAVLIDKNIHVRWWLRTPGSKKKISHSYVMAYVKIDGSIDNGGKYVAESLGVRPAIWVDLDN